MKLPRCGISSPSRPRHARWVAGVVATLTLVAAAPPLVATSGAQDAIVVDDPRLHPSLAGVEVTGEGRQSVVSAVRTAEGRLAAAGSALSATIDEIEEAATLRQRLEETLVRATDENVAATALAEMLRSRLRQLAVHSYQQGSSSPSGAVNLDRVNAELLQQRLVNTVSTNQQAELRSTREVIERSRSEIDETTASLTSVGAAIEALSVRREEHQASVEQAAADVDRSRSALADWRIGADVAGSDIPLVVLDAYVKAAERIGAERPECGLRWWGLAGIGKVETHHATYLGTRPGPDGVTLKPIIGIPLDGNNNTAVIPDSDGGLMDGDTVWDRAVGPMQFIPGTWRMLGRDGDGDGIADPHNIYDSALSAAALLCGAGGSGLDQPAPLRRAALAYNASGAYADLVVRHAFDYADRADQLIPPLPDLSWLAAPADATVEPTQPAIEVPAGPVPPAPLAPPPAPESGALPSA